MKMKRILLLTVFAISISLFLLTNCTKKDEMKGFEVVEEEAESAEEYAVTEEEVDEKEIVEGERVSEEAEELAQEAIDEGAVTYGIVTYASGVISINRETSWDLLDVEDSVELKDRVKTEADSFCEIQFEEFGLIRIQESTELVIRDVYLAEEKNNVNVNLKEGKILCKVAKLDKNEEFQVRTSTALAGVRGTEFMVTAEEDKSAHFAVKEGSVSVIPVDIADKLDEIEITLESATAKEVLNDIEIPEIIVTEDKEIKIDQIEAEKAAQEFEVVSEMIEQKIKEIDKKAVVVEKAEQKRQTAGTTKELPNRIKEMKQEINAIKVDVLEVSSKRVLIVEEEMSQPTEVSEPIQQELNEFKRMETKEFVIASKLGAKKEDEKKKPAYTKVTIKVIPEDAKIYVDGDESGKGKFSGLYLPNTELRVKAERKGFIAEEKKVIIADQTLQSLVIELKRGPLAWDLHVGNTPFIRKIVVTGEKIVVADANGKVSCISSTGQNIWTISTNNIPNNNSMPVVIGSSVIFSGSKELSVVNLNTGKTVKRISIGKDEFSSHLFGRRVVPFNDKLMYPSNRSLVFLDPDTLMQTLKIDLPENSNSSPAVYGDRIVMVDQKGTLSTINPQSGLIEHIIKSGALQPVSIAPTIDRDSAVFAGRDGTVVYIDLSKKENVWEQKIDIGEGVGIFQDVTMGKAGVYPFTGHAFYALSVENGKQLFNPVLSTCSPLYHKGRLYFGNQDRQFVMMDADTGRVIKRFRIDSNITVQPGVIADDIIIGTNSGTIYRLSPQYM